MNTSDIIALSSASIAFSAFLIAAYSSYETRKYNRISMMPVLDDKLIFNEVSERIGLFMENKGVGPAVLEKWELLVDGKHYRDYEIDRFEKLTEFLGLDEVINYGYFKPGSLLLQGQTQELFVLNAKPYSVDRSDRIRLALKRLKIKISYKSLYKERTNQLYEFDGSKRL